MSKKKESVPTMMSWCWSVMKRRQVPGCPLFEEGDIYCQLASKYLPLDTTDVSTSRLTQFPCGVAMCSQVFDCVRAYESHYNSCHRNNCHQCHRVFPSAHLLDVHILESHDVMFELLAKKQNMYQCLLEECKKKFQDSNQRRDHMIKAHKYPANFRFERKKKQAKNKSKSAQKIPNTIPMETDASHVSEMNTRGPCSPGCADKTRSPAQARVFSHKVPKDICFGAGSSRGFMSRKRGRGGSRQKHWHSQHQNTDTTVDIETVDMVELADALS